jgi:hypothetical protein
MIALAVAFTFTTVAHVYVPADAPVDAAAVDVAPTDAPVVEKCAPPSPKRVLRVAVQDVESDQPERARQIFTASLVTELRKLQGVSVIGMDEVRALVSLEATRQEMGCSQESCLSELADALGAEIVVAARITTLGDEEIVSFRRMDMRDGKSTGVDRRFAKGDGVAFLNSIGSAVEELFKDFALVAGAQRGVEKEAAQRLNPPPLDPWVFGSLVATSAAAVSGAAVAGVLTLVLNDAVAARIEESRDSPVAGADLKREHDAAQGAAAVANVGFGIAGVALASAGVIALFTDFAGYGNDTPE